MLVVAGCLKIIYKCITFRVKGEKLNTLRSYLCMLELEIILIFPRYFPKILQWTHITFTMGKLLKILHFFWNTKVICQDMVLIFDKLSLQSLQSFPYEILYTYLMPLYPIVICLHSTLLDSSRFSVPWWILCGRQGKWVSQPLSLEYLGEEWGMWIIYTSI